MRFLLETSRVSAAEVRQAIFFLGGRHQGDALAGAREELQDTRLTDEDRRILEAVVEQLAPSAQRSRPALVVPGLSPIRLVVLALLIALVVTVVRSF